MTPVDRFLREATRGLSRHKQAEARAELRSHLHERVNQLMLSGHSQALAQAQALEELGAPAQIAKGLRRNEHVHPLLSAAVLTGLAGVLLGFPVITTWQIWRTTSSQARQPSTEAKLRADGYVSLPEAQRQLQKAGIDLKFFGPWAKLQAARLPTLRLNDAPCASPVYADPNGSRLMPEVRPAHLFVRVNELPSCMALSGWPLEVRPDAVLFRGVELDYLPKTTAPFNSFALTEVHNIFQSWLYLQAVQNLMGTQANISPFGKARSVRTYQTSLSSQTPVLLLVRVPDRYSSKAYFMRVAWVQEDGTVQLPSEMERLNKDTWRVTLTDDLNMWLQTAPTFRLGVLLPLSQNTADAIRWQPLKAKGLERLPFRTPQDQ